MKSKLYLITYLALLSACSPSKITMDRNEIESILHEVEESTLIVGEYSAAIRISIPNRSVWSWNRSETPDNAPEYRWEIKVLNMEDSYTFGFGKWKYPGSQLASGNIKDLLQAGQSDIWKANPYGASRISRDAIRIVNNDQTITIIVEGKEYVDMLFSSEPSSAVLTRNSPYEDKSDIEIKVLYKAAFNN